MSFRVSAGPHSARWVLTVACALLAALGIARRADAQAAGSDAAPSDTMASLHYKGLTLTPVGYFAAEAVFRSRNETADIGSVFNAIPFTGTSNSKLTEFRGSARQSRLALLGEGKISGAKLSGFFESDFLGAGVTSNSNESNSYALRIRQFWGQAALTNGWSFAFGQMWSLITTDKKGIAPRQEFVPLLIDAQYSAGFNWARQFAVRVTKDISDVAWLSAAAEGPQMTFSAHGAPAPVLIGSTGGGLLNSTANYSTDVAPDVIGKLAIEPGFGHYEIKVLGRLFRDRIVDTGATASLSHTVVREAGGVGVGAVWPFYVDKFDVLDFGVTGLWGNGIGRYGASQLPDATVRADGSIVPIRAAHGLVTIEAHPSRKLDVYGYGGAEYAYRTAFLNAAGTKATGYGSPLFVNTGCTLELAPTGPYAAGAPGATCNADTRVLYQGNVGFWYRFYKGSAGTVAWGVQYSYTSRNTWSGVGGAPKAIDNMGFMSFRYYIP